MNILEEFIQEIESDSFIDEEGDRVILVKWAKDILERFEIALINGLDCEELLKRQGWKEVRNY